MNETIIKAHQCADLLVQDLREAHRVACDNDDGVLSILLRDRIGQVAAVEHWLSDLLELQQREREGAE